MHTKTRKLCSPWQICDALHDLQRSAKAGAHHSNVLLPVGLVVELWNRSFALQRVPFLRTTVSQLTSSSSHVCRHMPSDATSRSRRDEHKQCLCNALLICTGVCTLWRLAAENHGQFWLSYSLVHQLEPKSPSCRQCAWTFCLLGTP